MGPRKPPSSAAADSDAADADGPDDYKGKRDRNNDAVRRSREKSRAKQKETQGRVSNLKQENEALEERIKLLSKELAFLKDIFMAHAGSSTHAMSLDDADIKSLLQDDESMADQPAAPTNEAAAAAADK